MARAPRLALAGELHYLLQLGHSRQRVFEDDHDREAYLAMLREGAAQYRVAIHAYAMLDSEVHLLATPAEADALGRLMQSIGRRYVGAFNRRHARSGTLWQGRFRAAVIDGAALGHDATLQVELQPVCAGLVEMRRRMVLVERGTPPRPAPRPRDYGAHELLDAWKHAVRKRACARSQATRGPDGDGGRGHRACRQAGPSRWDGAVPGTYRGRKSAAHCESSLGDAHRAAAGSA